MTDATKTPPAAPALPDLDKARAEVSRLVDGDASAVVMAATVLPWFHALADECERLRAMFQQAFGCHHSWVHEAMQATKLRVEAESLRAQLAEARAQAEEMQRAYLGPWAKRAADALADEVDVLVRTRIIDSRSPAADALLSYRDKPTSERSDRIVAMEVQIDNMTATIARLTSERDALRRSKP